MRLVVLVNPAARAGQSGAALDAARPTLARGPWRLEERRSEGVGHLAALAAEAASASDVAAVVVCGGDGSVGAVASALAHTGVPLGLIPVGTGNDFARGLGLSRDPVAAAGVVVAMRRRTIDLGRVVGLGAEAGAPRFFTGVAGVGLDADALRHLARVPWLVGQAKYTYGGLRGLLTYRPRRVEFEAGGIRWSREVMFVAVTNSPYYGGGMRINPTARLDDGALDVCLVERMPRVKMLFFFPTVYRGTHIALPEVHTTSAARVKIDSPTPLEVCLDGELTDLRTPVAIEAVPGALVVLAP